MDEKERSWAWAPRGAEKTLKFLACFCVFTGLLFFVGGIALLRMEKVIFQIRATWFAVVPVVFGLSFLALSAAVALHLRLRSGLSRAVVRVCCVVAPLCAVPASFALMPAGQGRYVVTVVWIVPAYAYIVYALIEKRLERGDDRPLSAGYGERGQMSWKRRILIYALALLIAMAASALVKVTASWDNSDVVREDEERADDRFRRDVQTWEDLGDLPPFPSHLFSPGEGGSE